MQKQILMKIKQSVKCRISILLVFLLITLVLLIYVSIFCYLIKYQAKQKHLLPIHNTMNQNKFQIDDINQKQVIKSKIQT